MENEFIVASDIPRKGVVINCKKGEPAPLTPELMSKQLNDIGLYCKFTTPEILKGLIKEVEDRLPKGKNEAFGIYICDPEKVNLDSYSLANFNPTLECPFIGTSDSINASWIPSEDAIGYMTQLNAIVSKANFDELKKHFADFIHYEKAEETTTKKDTTEGAIKDFFAETLTTASNCMISGIDVADMKATCTRLITPQLKQDDNYSIKKTFVIFLLKNYNGKSADSIGAVALDWKLIITNYKSKKSSKHETSLTLSARAVTYDNISILEKHAAYVSKLSSFLMGGLNSIPPKTNKVKIYDNLPPAGYDAFFTGIPQIDSGSGQVETIVLYAANLDEVGIVDNSVSKAECSYSISLTTGFTNSESLSLGEELYMEAGCDILKVGIKISMNATFTKETSKSHTETITYTVPAETIAYLYQGFIQCAVLSMDINTGEFKYVSKGKYLTNFFKTSLTPLLSE